MCICSESVVFVVVVEICEFTKKSFYLNDYEPQDAMIIIIIRYPIYKITGAMSQRKRSKGVRIRKGWNTQGSWTHWERRPPGSTHIHSSLDRIFDTHLRSRESINISQTHHRQRLRLSDHTS